MDTMKHKFLLIEERHVKHLIGTTTAALVGSALAAGGKVASSALAKKAPSGGGSSGGSSSGPAVSSPQVPRVGGGVQPSWGPSSASSVGMARDQNRARIRSKY